MNDRPAGGGDTAGTSLSQTERGSKVNTGLRRKQTVSVFTAPGFLEHCRCNNSGAQCRATDTKCSDKSETAAFESRASTFLFCVQPQQVDMIRAAMRKTTSMIRLIRVGVNSVVKLPLPANSVYADGNQ